MGTVLIGNKHWGGIVLHLGEPPFGEITVPGQRSPTADGKVKSQNFGYVEIDEAWWKRWLELNQDSEMVKNKVIYKITGREELMLRKRG